jgi:ribose transport system substrate-binding protein
LRRFEVWCNIPFPVVKRLRNKGFLMPQRRTSSGNVDGAKSAQSTYLVGPILRACEVLKSFRFKGESIPLHELVARTSLNKTTVFRAAQTLVAGGLLERVAGNRYRSVVHPNRERSFRIGYAAMTTKSLFARDVTESIRVAAAETCTELIELDNRLSARVAIGNSEKLVRERVDLAIEFQVCHDIAPLVASKFAEAGIPMIAVHTPHPGATFFGGNNYIAGRIGGRALGRWALKAWNGKVDSVLLLGHAATGPLTNSRLTGTAVGITEILPGFDASAIVRLDAKGGYAETMDIVLKHLARSNARRILVGAINDAVALGALRAFTEIGRPEDCAIMGQNGTIAARGEMRVRGSRLIGSVAFFPERYGDHLMPLALGILRRKCIPPAVFIKHTLITAQNVDDFYPNDALIPPTDADSLLFGRYH